jgi:hypothetical protein
MLWSPLPKRTSICSEFDVKSKDTEEKQCGVVEDPMNEHPNHYKISAPLNVVDKNMYNQLKPSPRVMALAAPVVEQLIPVERDSDT